MKRTSRDSRSTRKPRPSEPRATWLSQPGLLIPPRIAPALAFVVPLIAAALVHLSATRTFFAQDDVTFLSRAAGIIPTPWTLARPLSEGVTWHLLYRAFGLHPLPYHVFLLALHLANTAMVYAIGRRLIGGAGAAWAAAMLFGTSSI